MWKDVLQSTILMLNLVLSLAVLRQSRVSTRRSEQDRDREAALGHFRWAVDMALAPDELRALAGLGVLTDLRNFSFVDRDIARAAGNIIRRLTGEGEG